MTKRERIRAAEEAYMKRLTGYEYSEIKIIDEYDEGSNLIKRKVERVIKHVPPDLGALTDFLGKHSRGAQKEEYTGGVVILPQIREGSDEQDNMAAAAETKTVS